MMPKLDARAGIEPAFQRSERCDLPLVDLAMMTFWILDFRF
jgi:hypothetical protein